MEDGRTPKDIVYGKLALGSRYVGLPLLRYKVVCKRDLKTVRIDFRELENSVEDRLSEKQTVSRGFAAAEPRRAVEVAANGQGDWNNKVD